MKISDYSTADYIPLVNGDVTVWDEYGYLGHTTNLTMYELYVTETENCVCDIEQEHLKHVMTDDLERIKTLIQTLRVHHRHARSINMLGKALKVIAGNPDFDDWEQIRFKQQELVEAESRQIEINTGFKERMDELVGSINSVYRSNAIDTEHLYEIILTKNRMVAADLQNLIMAVTLAKLNLVASTILNEIDVRKIIGERLTDISVADILRVSNIKVFQDFENLHFMIKFP